MVVTFVYKYYEVVEYAQTYYFTNMFKYSITDVRNSEIKDKGNQVYSSCWFFFNASYSMNFCPLLFVI